MSRTTQQVRALPTDEVVVLAQQDNMVALEELVRRHQKIVFVAMYQMMPERNDIADLAQEVLLRMCRSIKSVRNPKTFKYWLNRIMTNLFYDELRKSPRKLNTISMDAPAPYQEEGDSSPTRDVPDERDVPHRHLLQTELDEQIQASIQKLPEQFRTIVVLREVQGLSYEEIASLTDSNLGTVKSRLARARMKLQEMLKPYLAGTEE